MRRRDVLGALLAAPFLMGGADDALSTPVRRLYAALPRPAPGDVFSERLRRLLRRDRAAKRRRLDFDWRAGGQVRPDISDMRVKPGPSHRGGAVVEVSFFNHGERRFRRFFMTLERGRWVIDDVLLVPENLRLADLLRPPRPRRGKDLVDRR